MFSTVFRPSQKCVDEQKELQFQEWRKKNLAKIKSAMQGRPKIYEYQNKPKVVGANNM